MTTQGSTDGWVRARRLAALAVSHGTGDLQLHERGRHAAGRLAGTAHLLARPAGARS